MKSPTFIRDDLTLASYGYNSKSLELTSHKFIIVECSGCHTIHRKEYRNIKRQHVCPTVIGNNKHCYQCDQWKDLSLFNKNGKLSGGVSKLCKQCYNNHGAVKKYEKQRCARLKCAIKENDFGYYIQRRVQRLISKCRSDQVQCDIDVQHMINLWTQQNGLCFYTSLPMNGTGTDQGLASWNSPSVDRLYPERGYTKHNVVWCLNSVNSFKNSMDVIKFIELVNQIKWKSNI